MSGFPTIVPSSVIGKNPPSDKINIGQIGFGRIAMIHDLAETLKYDVARVVALAGKDIHSETHIAMKPGRKLTWDPETKNL